MICCCAQSIVPRSVQVVVHTLTFVWRAGVCILKRCYIFFFQSYGDILNKQIMRANMKLTKKDTDIAKFDDDGNHPAARTVMIVT